jgi:ATP-dependent exoDNAse (exonuclease V) alpha subunit
MADMDIGKSVFEYGQTYVALSRVQSLDGLYLSDFNPKNIRANPKVVAFYETIQPIEYAYEEEEQEEESLTFDSFAYKEEEENIEKNTKKIIIF